MTSPGRITGLAAVFDSAALINEGGQEFDELIAPGAFTSVLRRERRTAFLFNHDVNRLLGRVSSGTLRLTETPVGLHLIATLPDTSLGQEVAELVGRGDLTGGSFAFTVANDSWHKQPGSTRPLRVIRDLKSLADVSVVTHPAYGATRLTVERAAPVVSSGVGSGRDQRMRTYRLAQARRVDQEVRKVLDAPAPRLRGYGPQIAPGLRLRRAAKRIIHP